MAWGRWSEVVRCNPNAIHIGLTATPWKLEESKQASAEDHEIAVLPAEPDLDVGILRGGHGCFPPDHGIAAHDASFTMDFNWITTPAQAFGTLGLFPRRWRVTALTGKNLPDSRNDFPGRSCNDHRGDPDP